MATKWFLGVSASIWLPYGIFTFLYPTFLGEVAGLVASTPTAMTEVRAMYGGLEAAIGALCVTALLRPAFVAPVLWVSAYLTGGLALTRALGVLLDGGLSGYTVGALVFEASATVAAAVLARREPWG